MLLRRLVDLVLSRIIQEVPEGIRICEYDCRRVQCSQGEWETCERRLNHARGELMPEHETLQERAA
jgi:hypothetical protein